MGPAEPGGPTLPGEVVGAENQNCEEDRLRKLNHEVSQPLAAVVANAAAALRWLRRLEPELEEAGAAVERILQEATRAADIVRQAADR